MKLLVTGSRKCEDKDYELFESWLDKVLLENNLEVSLMIHGGATGADQFADRWAKARLIPVKVVRPDYTTSSSKVAPLIRNIEMVDECDVCVAVFKYQRIKGGTVQCSNYARKEGKLIAELEIDFK